MDLFLGYIGPGAGFAFLGSFAAFVAAILLACLSLLSLPIRLLIKMVRNRKSPRPDVRRVVVIGMDGLDPRRVRELMDEGRLPNFQCISKYGHISDLQTTCPPISPVAWSSFMTGVNPGKHNIFDFLGRNLKSMRIELSSCRIHEKKRSSFFSRYGGEMELLRKSQPFWKVLGDHGVFSTILRVPITFPPEPFNGLSLSAMCTPDLRGTQGTFTLFESKIHGAENSSTLTGGNRIEVVLKNNRITTKLPGPVINGREISATIDIRLFPERETHAEVKLSGQRFILEVGQYSHWVRVAFRVGWRRVYGLCRFLLLGTAPQFKLYVTPINIDPEFPAIPISHPPVFAPYLAKLNGPFATLGLAEDTWARNEGILSDEKFLEQAEDIQAERETMFFESLKRTRNGCLVCVFDLTDRIQHMFGAAPDETSDLAQQRCDAVNESYRRMDRLLGETLKAIDSKTVLFVMSDHGFSVFRRGVNLNAWLKEKGLLHLKPGAAGGDYLADIDWSRTKAYSFGLSGIYLNVHGRESHGIVTEGERKKLKEEMASSLLTLVDPQDGASPIKTIYDSAARYKGPYCDNGPDLVVGYNDGYRASWGNAVGSTSEELLTDNTRCWRGDHCIDYRLVPGVLLCNRAIVLNGLDPHILDLAPTILDLFGVPVPEYMDGKLLSIGGGKE